MLKSIMKIIKINNCLNIEINETVDRVNITASAQNIIKISKENIILINENISNDRDVIIDFIISINGNNINFSGENFYELYSDYEEILDMNNDKSCVSELKICIKKIIENRVLSIYSLKSFLKYVNSISCYSFLELLNKKKYCYFEILDKGLEINCYTNMFYFYTKGLSINNEFDEIISKHILDTQLQNCSYANRSAISFEPYNFKLEGMYNKDIGEIFQKLTIIFSLITIFDISEIKSDNIEISLYGKSVQSFNLNYKETNFDDLNYYYSIFKWIFEKENITDKLLIVRNVLSINLYGKIILEVPQNIISTIKSNYKIYLHDNFEKYVSSKSIAISNLLDIQKQILDLSNNLTDNFFKNIIAICSFIFTLIIVNPISDGNLTDIFTKDITIISLVLTIFSIIFLVYNLYDINSKKENLYLLHENINTIYSDILSEETLNEIINNNNYYKESKQKLDKKIKILTILWGIIIFTFFILTIILGGKHFYNNYNTRRFWYC